MNSFLPNEIWERRIAGVRRVMSSETCYDRFEKICSVIGESYVVSNRKVLVVGLDDSPRIIEMFTQQSYMAKEFVKYDDLDEKLYCSCDLIAFFSSSCTYGPFYLEDMVNVFKYTGCSYVTKQKCACEKDTKDEIEHRYSSHHCGRDRSVYWRRDYDLKQILDIDKIDKLENGYSSDCFSFWDTIDPSPIFVFPNAKEIKEISLSYISEWELYGRVFTEHRLNSTFSDIFFVFASDSNTDFLTECMARHLSLLYSNISIKKKIGG